MALKTDDERRVDAFKMWFWRRMLKIPKTAQRTNKSILEELDDPVRFSVLCE